MDKQLLVEIGKRIQQRRKALGYTQEQLAELMNVSIQMVSNMERGNKAIRIDNLINLSNILKASIDYILTGKDSPSDLQKTSCSIEKLNEKDRNMIKMMINYCMKHTDQ